MSSECGVSELIGAMLLVSLVILGVAIAAVAILSQPPPEDIPQVTALADNQSKTVYLYHDGGDSLLPEEIKTIVNGEDTSFSLAGNESWPWSAGKTLQIDYTGQGMPEYVQLVYRGGSTQTLILTAYFVPPEIIGAPTSGTTTSPTTSPTTTTTTTTPTTEPTPTGNGCDDIGANFNATPTSGDIPLTVSFTDNSTGGPTTWYWTFGDGNSSGLQNPQHTYYSVGDYTVSLNASKDDPGCSKFDIETKTDYIHATCPNVVAGFTGSPRTGEVPLMVHFTDQSTGNPTSWSWTFGDGGTSAGKNPVHEYTSFGPFTVTLTAGNDCGSSNTVSYVNYIYPRQTWTGRVINLTKMCGARGYLQDGTYYQFKQSAVTSITINGHTYSGNQLKNKIVKLEIEGDQYSGYIYMHHPVCYDFLFNVNLYIDGTFTDTGIVTAITAQTNKNHDVSTLTYVLDPSCTSYTHLIINSVDIINRNGDSSRMIISNMKVIHDNVDPYVNKFLIDLKSSYNQINTEADISVY
ncbi:MAG TPA: PKD domain-containing protein [Methanoregulaceae archaeon]|nr:PKD domain-containing protein [Methanoregulaceae archaeon]